MMFSRKLAGIGAVAALVGSALVPSVAFADPTHDSTPATDVKDSATVAAVTIEKNITANDDINVTGSAFTFVIEATPCDSANPQPSTDTACQPAAKYPSGTDAMPTSAQITFDTNVRTKTATVNLPGPTKYGAAGIYVWTVTEQGDTVTGHTVTYSQAKYRVKAYVVKNATTGALEYKAVTIAQDKNDAGTAITDSNKREKLAFTNVYKDVAPLVIDKTVVNNSGLPEDANGEYSFTVTITYPANFTPTTAPTVEGALAGSVTGATAGTTSIGFKLKHGNSATITGLPVGTSYTLTETNTGTTFSTTMVTKKTSSLATPNLAETSKPGRATDAATIGDGGNVVNVTNEYEPTTPTGVILEVLPYVLMIGIPLLAIASYIALRRKMNL